MEERLYDFWAATLQNGYIGEIIKIIDDAGGAKSFYEIIEKITKGADVDKRLTGLTPNLIKHFCDSFKSLDEIERNYYEMMNDNIYYVNHNDNDFPDKLRKISSSPYGIFVKGCLPDENVKSVAIVGARECSEYGRMCAEYYGDKLAKENVAIVSGMAWGIDGISQMAAIKAGGRSFGVLGCGADVIYPRKNRELYEMLTENGNGIISEYALKTEAVPRLFPPRNRIISGLCDVLLVIEARPKSGTLITVKMAIEQGKTVMALPGRITDELSRGCLMLINEGAGPAISVDSVMAELYGGRILRKGELEQMRIEPFADDFDESEKTVYNILSFDPISTELISQKTGIGISEVLIILSKLDLKGYAREVSHGSFVKCVHKIIS